MVHANSNGWLQEYIIFKDFLNPFTILVGVRNPETKKISQVY